jgi:hypothetical protein
MNLPVLAGTLSTVLFAVGMLPMLAWWLRYGKKDHGDEGTKAPGPERSAAGIPVSTTGAQP